MTKVLIGAGCFWGVEEYYRKINGVLETRVGYSGGVIKSPTYDQVCNGDTEHAEVVSIKYDEKLISYIDIIDYFWLCHDPKQLNRQGPDFGRQYRSIIFYYSENQKNEAMISKKTAQEKLSYPIVTEIKPAKEFYLAEEYHQLYLHKRS